MAKKKVGKRSALNSRRETVSLARMEEVARLYLRGETQSAIGKKFGVSQQAIAKNLVKIREHWRERCARAYEDHLGEAIAKLLAVEAAAWEGWEKSLKVQNLQRDEEGETTMGPYSKHVKQQKWTTGDPAYLTIIERCVQTYCKLLGLLDEDAGSDKQDEAVGIVEVRVSSRDEVQRVYSFAEYEKAKVS